MKSPVKSCSSDTLSILRSGSRTMFMLPVSCTVLTSLCIAWIIWVPLDHISTPKQYLAAPDIESEKKHEILSTIRSVSNSSSLLQTVTGDSCSGRRVYIHRLPHRFNKDILEGCDTFLPWFSMCHYFTNLGMGVPVDNSSLLSPQGTWYQTNQYALDVLFHHRLLYYPCLTDSPEDALLFYIPYYAGLDVLRYHYANVTLEKKNELGMELIQRLRRGSRWKENLGRDHLLVMGKITWDFRRNEETQWGNTLLKTPDLGNILKLLIERDPWEVNEISVPHPTYFHPTSDDDITAWLSKIAGSDRKHLISFAGMPRDPEHIRTHLIKQCESSPSCELLRCIDKTCDSPEPTMHLFMSSDFCMQPPGDSATRRSVFDSLIAGCIPVLFDVDTAYFQYPWHLPEDTTSYSVYVSSEDVKHKGVSVIDVVEKVSPARRTSMRNKIINEIVPGLLYAQPGSKLVHYEDAFDISMRRILDKVASL